MGLLLLLFLVVNSQIACEYFDKVNKLNLYPVWSLYTADFMMICVEIMVVCLENGMRNSMKMHWLTCQLLVVCKQVLYLVITVHDDALAPDGTRPSAKTMMTDRLDMFSLYRQVSNIRCTLVSNNIVDHSDVVGASPVSAAPTTSSFSTQHLASLDWAKTTARLDEKHLSLGIWCDLY